MLINAKRNLNVVFVAFSFYKLKWTIQEINTPPQAYFYHTVQECTDLNFVRKKVYIKKNSHAVVLKTMFHTTEFSFHCAKSCFQEFQQNYAKC